MKVRKMNAHRARLSFEKPTGWVRKTSKRGKSVLVMWNMAGRGHHSRLYPYQERLLRALRRFQGAVYIPRRTGMSTVFRALYIDPRKDAP